MEGIPNLLNNQISELEQTQAQLRASEQRLESILNSIEGVVWSIHPETFETIYINPAVEQIFGCSVAEFFANPNLWFEIIHPDDRSIITNAFITLKEQGKSRSEYRIIRRDGQVRWLSVNSYLVYDETGKPIRIDGITTDISDRIESQSRLEQIARHIPGVIYQFRQRPDGTFHFPYASEGMREIYGISPEEVRNDASQAFGIIHPDDLDRVSQSITNSAEHLTLWYCEYRACLPDGRILWLVGNATPQRGPDGSTLWHGYIRDISEQQAALRERKAAQLELEQFFNVALDLLCIADVNGHFRRLNCAWETILGYEVSELEGQLFLDFVHPEDIAATLAVMSELSEQKPVIQFTNRYRAKDGNYRYIEWRSFPCGDLIYAAARDITERKQAEIESWQMQNFLNSIVENIPNMLFVKDAKNLQFLRFNKAGEELLGYPKEALLGKNDYDFFPPAEADFFIAKDREVLARGNVLDIPEEQIQTNHQGTRILHTRKIPILDEFGNPKYLLGISEDITESKQAEIQLKEISERLSLALKSGGIGCWEWDIIKNTLVWDDRMYELYGVTKNSDTRLAYDIWTQGLHPEDRDVSETLIRQAVLGQAEFDPEFRVVHPDGSIHFIKAFALVRRDAEGNPQKMIGVNFDISEQQAALRERKEAENKLRQNEQKYYQILDAITDMVLVKGPKSRIAWANKAFREYYAMTNEQLQDMIDAPFNEPDYTLQYIRDDAYVFETGQSLEIEEPVTRYDGKVQIFNTIKSVIRNEVGEKILTVGVSRDITEQQAVLRDRQRQELALRLIVEGTAAKTGEEFFKTCVQYLAQVLEVRYGFIAEFIDTETFNAKTLAFWAGEDFGDNFTYNLVGAPCENVYTQGELCLYPNSVQSLFPEDADLVSLQAESYAGLPIIDADGNRLGLLAVLDNKPMVQDIEMQSAILRIFATRAGAEMERMQAEAALRRSEIQLRQQTEELEAILKKLQNTQTQLIQAEKMSSLGQLVAGVAHEINNPVSFIYSNIQPATNYASDLIELVHLYQEHYPSPPQAIADLTKNIDFEYLVMDFSKLLASMKTGATRIKDIVKSLRTFSRLDEADFKAIDIHENIDSTLVILQNRLNGRAGEPKIHVIKNYGDLPLVECYGGLLNQVFMNLFVNGIDAIEQQRERLESAGEFDYTGKIIITTAITSENQVLISIQDNGCGMSPEVQAQIFNPFFTTKPIGKGTGMGLATSYQIIEEQHQGSILVNSTLGDGTEFAITLSIKVSPIP